MLSISEFWNGIGILLRNQHAIQKQLCGIKILHIQQITSIELENYKRMNENNFQTWIETFNLAQSEVTEYKLNNSLGKFFGEILITKFIFKNSSKSAIGCQLIDFFNKEFYSISFFQGLNDFSIIYRNETVCIELLKSTIKFGNNWAEYYLKPKFLKWCKHQIDLKKQINSSLSLIDIEEYVSLHKKLKDKYAKDIINIWPESTDPIKFVHEDVSIAAYLICLWKSTNTEPRINFVDLGCGNGLLVYILNNYGYSGYGIDVRRRKIWDLYPPNIKLIERTIEPNSLNPNLNADWIIGNHSDELSPWIPVIAARNSINTTTNFFLLPCCAFEFSGKKYQRKNPRESIYNDFLQYTEMITKKCGYSMLKDRLKIPSTKRIAIIGISKKLNNFEQSKEINKFLIEEMKSNDIKFRSKEELVKNCTTIDEDIRNNIILKIFNYLIIPLQTESVEKQNWVKGRKANFQEIVAQLNSHDFQHIKNQCGGLKTLIKNYHEIFIVTGNNIEVRKPEYNNEKVKTKNCRKRNCFFFLHHPNGCPLNDVQCSFIHPIFH